MGQSQSCAAASVAADRGWPAYMSTEMVRRAMLRFPAEKSVLSDRVRFLHQDGGRVEYVRLPGGQGTGVTYQRLDDGQVPDFPQYLARHELPVARCMPHEVVDVAAAGVRVRLRGAEAVYVLRPGGSWVRNDGIAQFILPRR